MLKLNLGSCDNLLGDYTNVDRFDFSRLGFDFQVVDLNRRWPWEDSSVDAIRANDIFEHLWPTFSLQGDNQGFQVRRTDVPAKAWVMNEAHRVLRPGGTLDIIVPTTDGRGAWQDPTHVTFWTPNDFFYYCEHWEEWKRFRRAYRITAQFRVRGAIPGFDGRDKAWSVITEGHAAVANQVTKLYVPLEAIK